MRVPALMAACLLAAFASLPARAAASSPECQVMAVSPSFTADRTLLCARQSSTQLPLPVGGGLAAHNGPVEVFLSTDAGRSWRLVPGEGLPEANDDHFSPTLSQVAFSPMYATDRALYVWAGSDGLFRSTDAGATWRQAVLPLAGEPGVGTLTPLAVTVREDDETHTRDQVGGFAYAFPNTLCEGDRHAPLDAIVVWPGATPAGAGPCRASRLFLVPHRYPLRPALLLQDGLSFATGPDRAYVSQCDAELTCATTTLDVPGRTVGGWADPVDDDVFYVATSGSGGTRVWRTPDGGATWAPWTSVQRLLSGRAVFTVSFAGDASRRTLLVTGELTRAESRAAKTSYGIRVYDSIDRGATWTLVGVQPFAGQPGRGTLPFTSAGGSRESYAAVLRAGGRLFTLAGQDRAPARVWCSTDHGRTWSRLCAK